MYFIYINFFVTTYFVKMKKNRKSPVQTPQNDTEKSFSFLVLASEKGKYYTGQNRTKVLWYLAACLFVVPLSKHQLAVKS
jgi:hypothetical protein